MVYLPFLRSSAAFACAWSLAMQPTNMLMSASQLPAPGTSEPDTETMSSSTRQCWQKDNERRRVHQAKKGRAEKGFSAERKRATRSLTCPVDSMGRRGPNSIRQAKEKAWPSFSCMPRNLPDEFIRVGSQGEKKIVRTSCLLQVKARLLTCSYF